MYRNILFSKYVSTSEGKWYYLPFNKEVIQLILASNDYNQENVEMLINSINAKIVFSTLN
jgi:hypothetical protein